MLSHPSFSLPLINEDLPAGPQLMFTLNNRFFRHQACYSLLPAKPGGQADRDVSLCKYKVVDWDSRTQREGMGLLEYQVMPSLLFVAHDGVLCTVSNGSAPDRGKWCGPSGQAASHPAGSFSSSQPDGPPCWASPLAFGLIARTQQSTQTYQRSSLPRSQKQKEKMLSSGLRRLLQFSS